MKTGLQLLIEVLQKEKDYLEQEIQTCIKEQDYLGANAFTGPLEYTSEKLQILKNLDNSNYDKIRTLKNDIRWLKEMARIDKYGFKRWQERLTEHKANLFKLEKETKKFHIDNDELIIGLEKLLSKEILGLEFVLNEKLIFSLSIKETTLKIEIKRRDAHSLDDTATRLGQAELRIMGFQVNDKNAVKEIPDFQENKILPTIELLSRITYDVFGVFGGKEAKITWFNF